MKEQRKTRYWDGCACNEWLAQTNKWWGPVSNASKFSTQKKPVYHIPSAASNQCLKTYTIDYSTY